jgi:hypothetical protein
VIAKKNSITISGTSVTITGITVDSALESNVKTATPTFTWEISFDSGTTWNSMGTSGPHTMYWTQAAPLSPPFKSDNGATYAPLYDLALQKACGYANGASSLSVVISNINQGIDGDINYQPANSIGSQHPLNAYTTSGGCQCSDLANLLRGLIRSIGIDGTTLYIWAGSNSGTITRYVRASTGASFQSFRIIRASHDSAEQNPHFSFHSVVSTNSLLYDPSYGLSYGSLSFDETAFNNTPQQVSTSVWSNDVQSGFTCSH